MDEFIIGGFVVSHAGHDSGKCYVINQIENEYVYLVDGRIRTLDRPKKKKKLHVQILLEQNQDLADKVRANTVKNEEIKRAIKLLRYKNSDKEDWNV
jgi:ribosomal protein L14E/L6E/L27E